ncbi:hypothetical protein H2O73_01345 [Vibrio sp. 404]|uniref:Hydroxylamine reductase n=1 Tax=Vibrio marinisediminis TaxID=2758441 RepID=A0A7W2FMS6_9VIBR|nr:hypothetical protein [Vibrio marinisediminis]MBA5760970.1 hypothetical protein [Vibrio marinisediminis]
MVRILNTLLAVITGFFVLIGGLLIAIPLAIVGAITGRRLVKAVEKAQYNQTNQQGSNHRVIDGEYEEVAK